MISLAFTLAVAAGAVVALVAVAIALVRGHRGHRRRSQQDRLEAAFNRAKQVRASGSGVQGRPYSIYTDRRRKR